MNLFVWDDYNWKVIDETDEYDKTVFFIVRKLFVQWPKQKNVDEVYNDVIRQHFEEHGSIESVETVNATSSNSVAASADASNMHEAYVTFVQSEHAFNAFLANRRHSKAIKVLPADTWHQPDTEIVRPEEVHLSCETFHRCNDPSHKKREEANFDLSQMSLVEDYHFCEHTGINATIEFHKYTLKRIREINQPFKSRLHDLTLNLDMRPNDININCLSNDEFLKRAAQILNALVGDKFKKMSLVAPHMHITVEMLNNFAPLLQRLDSLYVCADSLVLYQLLDCCPNLFEVNIAAKSWVDEELDATIRNWSSLMVVTIVGESSITSDTKSGAKFCQFIEMNPQLESLELKCIVDNDLLKAIAKHLSQLEFLEIVRSTMADINLVLNLVAGFKHLVSLKINTLEVKRDDFKSMIECARRFKQMKQLSFVTLFQNYRHGPEDFKFLLACPVKIHDGCNCHGSKRVVGFGGGIDEVTLPTKGQVILVIFNTSTVAQTDDMYTPHGVLHGIMAHYPDIVDRFAVLSESNCQHYHISHA